LKPISIALDKLQKTSASIADSTEVWKTLEEEFHAEQFPRTVVTSMQDRMKQALTPAHYLANILHPLYLGKKLSEDEIGIAMDYALKKTETCPSFMPMLVKYRAQSGPFVPPLFQHSLLNEVTAVEWWKSLTHQIAKDAQAIAIQLISASASTAGLERIFSLFGLVHTEIRNRLGNEKAGKLVFVLQSLKSKPSAK
ncbi:unnamed protein product, partial [Allacma fusca]